MQTTLNARPIQIAARANSHDRPRGLRRGAFTNSFRCRIFVSRASFAPTAIVILAALKPIAPAQNPILGHVVTDGPQSAKYLPRSVNVVHTPASVPRAIRFLGLDQIMNRVADAADFGIEIDVAEQLQCPRGQIAAGWI